MNSIIGTLGVLLEDTKRIDDYSVFTFPRVFEGFWYLLKKLFKLRDVPNFSRYLFAFFLAIIFVMKKHFPKEIPSHYLRQFDFFFGN